MATIESAACASAAHLLAPGATVSGFTVCRREAIEELDADAYVLRHEASGARLLYLACDDENKAFAIGFKTPPADDTGVFHILEHSVLCGSAKFPVKEPFVDLIKSSMQTFLNAMTYPDKTIYPVASTNEQDLLNLPSPPSLSRRAGTRRSSATPKDVRTAVSTAWSTTR